ncbi:conserved hypothetical protein [Vibrio crassostreae]|nr:conserved hypothetical protein [Vibrio crassostreae]
MIAGAICAVVSPPRVAVFVAGTTAPNWFEYALNFGNRHINHQALPSVFLQFCPGPYRVD